MLDWLSDVLEWLVDLLLWVPKKLWELLLDGLALVIEAIPVPGWLQGADPFSAVPPEVVYFADDFLLAQGIGIVIGAYVIRFLIRRLPFVG